MAMISVAVSSILTAVAPDREMARAGAEPRRLMGLALKAAAEAAAPRRRIVRRMLGTPGWEGKFRVPPIWKLKNEKGREVYFTDPPASEVYF